MKFDGIRLRIVRAAIDLVEPPRAADEMVESILSCHFDGDRVAKIRFLQVLAAEVLAEPDDLKELSMLVFSDANARIRERAGVAHLFRFPGENDLSDPGIVRLLESVKGH